MKNLLLQKMIHYNGNDAKRINHTLKVNSFAEIIASGEGCTDEQKFVIMLASVFHDIGIHEAERKYNSSSGKYQEIEGPAVARQLTAGMDIVDDVLERALYIIGNHHSYAKIDGTDFQIVVEADFLVNIYEEEMKKETVESLSKKIFKTAAGTELLNTMFIHRL